MSTSTRIIGALVVALLLLLGVLSFGYGPWATHQQSVGEVRATTAYNAAIGEQKATAGKLLQVETDRANAATTALADFKRERERQDVENQSTIADLAGRLRTAAGAAGRLRDPNASPAGCGRGGGGAQGANPASASTGPADPTEADGLFSEPATQLLQKLTLEADAINVAYTSCRADAFYLRGVLK